MWVGWGGIQRDIYNFLISFLIRFTDVADCMMENKHRNTTKTVTSNDTLNTTGGSQSQRSWGIGLAKSLINICARIEPGAQTS